MILHVFFSLDPSPSIQFSHSFRFLLALSSPRQLHCDFQVTHTHVTLYNYIKYRNHRWETILLSLWEWCDCFIWSFSAVSVLLPTAILRSSLCCGRSSCTRARTPFSPSFPLLWQIGLWETPCNSAVLCWLGTCQGCPQSDLAGSCDMSTS